MLQTLGMASGSAILFACGGAQKSGSRTRSVDPAIRSWLKEAVSILVGAGFDSPHALAVSRRRTTAAIDVLGTGVGRGRCDGVVLAVREKSGLVREQVTNDLSREGVLAAARVLAGKARAADVDFGAPPGPVDAVVPDPDELNDGQMLARAAALAARDKDLSSRIVYAASTVDIDDARVWSVAPKRVLEQRLVRVRRSLLRVAWHGSRPFVSEAARAWTGGIDAQDLTDDEIAAARSNVLALLTPQAFEDGERAFVLEPTVAAALLDAAVRTLMTNVRPQAKERRTPSERVTLVDDPTVPDAYGSLRFDDMGAVAVPTTLIDNGRLVGPVTRARRPGHVGRAEMLPAHLRLSPGTTSADSMLEAGMILEGHTSTLVDPSSDRFVIQVARAREVLGRARSGRMFADVEIVGNLSEVFGALGDLSKETKSIGIRDEIDGLPRHRSIETPWMLGKGMLRQRRRPL
jgi:predicted Zn-dependent protease